MVRRVLRSAVCVFAATTVGACGLTLSGELGGDPSNDGGLEDRSVSEGSVDGPLVTDEASVESGTDAAIDAGPYGTRVKSGLVALYEMQEGAGSTLNDTSGFGTPLPATFASATDVSWVKGGVSALNNNLASTAAGTKVSQAVKGTNEVSVEVWAKFTSTPLIQYARLVTFSTTGDNYNIAVTSKQTEFWFYLLTDFPVGSETLVTPSGIMHFVGTFKGGVKSFYVNGALKVAITQTGTLATWSDTHPLSFFNSQAKDRPMFPGELHLVALYSRALSAAEIAQNYAAGPNP